MDGGDSLGILDVQEVGQSAVVHQAPLLQHGAHAAVLHQDVLAAQDMQQMVVLDDESCKGIMLDGHATSFRVSETKRQPRSPQTAGATHRPWPAAESRPALTVQP